MSMFTPLPEHLRAAYNWIDGAGEWIDAVTEGDAYAANPSRMVGGEADLRVPQARALTGTARLQGSRPCQRAMA